MQHQDKEKLLVVMLEDIIQHMLPRILGIRRHLKHGGLLSDAEVTYLMESVHRLNDFYISYHKDPQCRVIYATIAHLLFKVIRKALKHESRNSRQLKLPVLDEKNLVMAVG